MKNSLKLSHYLPHHYQDNVYNEYPGKRARASLHREVVLIDALFRREVSIDVCWLRLSNLRSVPAQSRARSRMAHALSEMLRVRPVVGRVEHMLRTRRQNVLQIGLHTVGLVASESVEIIRGMNYSLDWCAFARTACSRVTRERERDNRARARAEISSLSRIDSPLLIVLLSSLP